MVIHTTTPEGHRKLNYVERVSNCAIISKKDIPKKKDRD